MAEDFNDGFDVNKKQHEITNDCLNCVTSSSVDKSFSPGYARCGVATAVSKLFS
jgi:hypothetical protein